MPWSISATSILAGLWLIVLIPTLDGQALRRVLATPAGGLPVMLWALGLVGMLWADVSLAERLSGLGPFHKLLYIPLLIAQFQRSDRAAWLMVGFLGSCTLLLLLSFALVRASALAASVGLVIVVQNMVGSLFNSHLFDFTHGWTYVIGVGVAGGMMLRAAGTERSQA